MTMTCGIVMLLDTHSVTCHT